MQHFTYKYWFTTQTKGGEILKKRETKQTLNLNPSLPKAAAVPRGPWLLLSQNQRAKDPPPFEISPSPLDFFISSSPSRRSLPWKRKPHLHQIFFPSSREPRGWAPSAQTQPPPLPLGCSLLQPSPHLTSTGQPLLSPSRCRSLSITAVSFHYSSSRATSLTDPDRSVAPSSPAPSTFLLLLALSADHRSFLSRPTQLQQRDPRTTAAREDINAGLQWVPQQQQLNAGLQRTPTETGRRSFPPQTASTPSASSAVPARPRIHHRPAAPPEAEEKKKMTEGDRSAVRQIQRTRTNQIWKGERKGSRSENKTKTDLLVAFWVFCR